MFSVKNGELKDSLSGVSDNDTIKDFIAKLLEWNYKY